MQTPLDVTLAALADPSRRQVIDLLKHRPRRAGEIASESGMSPPAMSRHLRHLLRSGLIEAERVEGDARLRLFRLKREPFDALGEWLAEVESHWTRQLDAFRQQAEAGRQGGVERPGGGDRVADKGPPPAGAGPGAGTRTDRGSARAAREGSAGGRSRGSRSSERPGGPQSRRRRR